MIRREQVETRYKIIDKIIEIEIYVYIVFMFLSKGEAVRNILLFSGFILWLTTLKYRQNKRILSGPVPLLFWGFMATILLSVIFSLDPVYSFKTLRGAPLKSVMILCLVSTVLSDEIRLRRFVYISYFILLFTITIGYYSYWAHGLDVMKPDIPLRTIWQAGFAVNLNTLMPFAFIILLMTTDSKIKKIVLLTIIAGVLGVILSTSRGGIAGLISMVCIALIFFSKRKKLNFRTICAGSLFFVILFSVSLFFSPMMKVKFIYEKNNMMSLGRRTEIWAPLIAAASQRPVFGWGYGPKIFKIDEPFKNTPYKVAPLNHDDAFRNPHNPFLRIFFHQGITGAVFYLALLITAAVTFWRGVRDPAHFKSYFLLACTCILTGTFFINALVENSPLQDLAFVLGLGLAAGNLKNEDSDH